MTLVIVAGLILTSCTIVTEEAPAETTDEGVEDLFEGGGLEFGEHGFTQSPGDYWTPVVLPEMSDSDRQ